MTTSIEQLRNALNGATTQNVLQIQPVEPRELTSDEVGKKLGYGILGIAVLTPLLSLLLWVALGTVHDLWPALLAVAPSYWQTMTLLVGMYVVAAPFRGRPWKWARR